MYAFLRISLRIATKHVRSRFSTGTWPTKCLFFLLEGLFYVLVVRSSKAAFYRARSVIISTSMPQSHNRKQIRKETIDDLQMGVLQPSYHGEDHAMVDHSSRAAFVIHSLLSVELLFPKVHKTKSRQKSSTRGKSISSDAC